MKRKNKTKRNKIKQSKLKQSKIKRNKRNKTKRIKKKQGGGALQLPTIHENKVFSAPDAKTKIFSPKYSNRGWNPPPKRLVAPLFLYDGEKPIEDKEIQEGQQFRVILLPDLRDDRAKIVQFIKKGSKSEPERYKRKCKGKIESARGGGMLVILDNDRGKMEVSLSDLKKVAYMELLADKPLKYEVNEYSSSSELNLRYVSGIDSGSYGQVISCIQVDKNNKVWDEHLPPIAVKLSINKDIDNSERLISEYEIMKELNASVKEECKKFFPEVYSDLHNLRSTQKGIVMEYLEPHIFAGLAGEQLVFKNLSELLQNKSGFELSPNHKQHYCRDLAYGISAMHAIGIWHGDLKPENIVIAHGSGMGQLKIIDFDSCSHTFKPGESPRFDINCCHTHPINGTPLYLPPENNGESAQFARQSEGKEPLIELGPSYDWWTYGLIVFEITTGRVAYSMKENGKHDKTINTPKNDHNQLYAFLQKKSQMYMNLAKNESESGKFFKKLVSLNSGNMALLNLAFMFFQPQGTRPFLCLDDEQMISYRGKKSEDYQSIVNEALFSNH